MALTALKLIAALICAVVYAQAAEQQDAPLVLVNFYGQRHVSCFTTLPSDPDTRTERLWSLMQGKLCARTVQDFWTQWQLRSMTTVL